MILLNYNLLKESNTRKVRKKVTINMLSKSKFNFITNLIL